MRDRLAASVVRISSSTFVCSAVGCSRYAITTSACTRSSIVNDRSTSSPTSVPTVASRTPARRFAPTPRSAACAPGSNASALASDSSSGWPHCSLSEAMSASVSATAARRRRRSASIICRSPLPMCSAAIARKPPSCNGAASSTVDTTTLPSPSTSNRAENGRSSSAPVSSWRSGDVRMPTDATIGGRSCGSSRSRTRSIGAYWVIVSAAAVGVLVEAHVGVGEAGELEHRRRRQEADEERVVVTGADLLHRVAVHL